MLLQAEFRWISSLLQLDLLLLQGKANRANEKGLTGSALSIVIMKSPRWR